MIRQKIWKDVKNYEGLYQISNLGEVKSLSKKVGKGKGYIKPEKILKQTISKDGYFKVTLCKDGKTKYFRVHRLVAQAFIPNLEDKPVVNHIDENKLNNYVDNLEWVTEEENKLYSYNIHKEEFDDISRKNVKKAINKVTQNILAYKNGEFIGEYKGKESCAKEIGISPKTIYNRLNGRYTSRSGYTFELKKEVVA
ncbi:MAG: NUMOD4 motif-containing HNH endonuclease [Clostridia bacterium]|nr:NUMOD4 motif-containing HNH endonuclease [Clostridia bacterium]